MNVGFSGSREGMNPNQRKKLVAILTLVRVVDQESTLHHGDCIGADAEAHDIAAGLGFSICIHPPRNPQLRAHRKPVGSGTTFEPEEYLTRNRNIIFHCPMLIACPRDDSRGGTWYTIRKAAKQKRHVIVLWPGGVDHLLDEIQGYILE